MGNNQAADAYLFNLTQRNPRVADDTQQMTLGTVEFRRILRKAFQDGFNAGAVAHPPRRHSPFSLFGRIFGD